MELMLCFLSDTITHTSTSLSVMQNCKFHVCTAQDGFGFQQPSIDSFIPYLEFVFRVFFIYIESVHFMHFQISEVGLPVNIFIMVLCDTFEFYCLKCNILFFKWMSIYDVKLSNGK